MTYKMHNIVIIFAALAVACAALLAVPHKTEAVSNQGLVGYWSFDDGTSTVATDFSGNRNTGTIAEGTPVWVVGKRGKALNFQNSQYVTLASPNILSATRYTKTAWIRLTSCPNAFNNIISWNGSGGAGDHAFAVNSSCVLVSGHDGDFGYVVDPTAMALNRWYFVAVTYDSSVADGTNILYRDGVVVDSITAAAAPTGLGTMIGAYDDVSLFSGRIDEARVYSRALSGTEIAELYRAGASLPKPSNNLGLVGYWSFDEGTSTQATDFSGNRNYGTLTTTGAASPTWTTGKRGSALNFGFGNQAYVDAGTGSSLSLSGAMTTCAWVYLPDIDDGDIAIIGNGASDNGNGQYFLEIWNTGIPAFSWSDNSGPTYEHVMSAGGLMLENVWYHVCGVRNSAGVGFVFLNGTDVSASYPGSNIAVPSSPGGNTTIGRLGLGTEYFEGKIDEVRLYNRALSSTTIASLAQSGAVKFTSNSKTLTQGSTLNNGLVGLWTFDGNDTSWTSPTAGTTRDGSSSNNTGTMTNMTRDSAITEGKLGQAFNFNGTSYIDAANIDALESGDMSFSQWVKFNALAGTPRWIVQQWADSDDGPAIFTGLSNEVVFEIGGFGVGSISTAATLSTGRWYHIVGTAQGTTLTIYIDGAQAAQGTVTRSESVPTEHFTMGGPDGEGSVSGLNGSLDDVRIYNRALTAAEAKQLYLLGGATIRP